MCGRACLHADHLADMIEGVAVRLGRAELALVDRLGAEADLSEVDAVRAELPAVAELAVEGDRGDFA